MYQANSTLTFPSLANPNKRYRLYERADDNPAYNWRNDEGISSHISSFDTMGDGETQHASDCVVHKEDTLDVLRSFFAVIHEIPPGTLPRCVDMFLRHSVPSTERLKFAHGLKYNPNKTTYVNVNTCKKSTSDSKRHDRRWFKLHEYNAKSADSTPTEHIHAIRGILNADQSHDKAVWWFDSLAQMLAMIDVLGFDVWDVRSAIKDWDVLKSYARNEIQETLRKWELIAQWYNGLKATMWARESSQRFAENESKRETA